MQKLHVLILVFFAALSCLCGHSQAPAVITQYLDEQMNPVASNQKYAFVRQLTQQADSSYSAEVKFSFGALRMTGRYLDLGLTQPDGLFVYYYANGQKESEGNYKQGNKAGIWHRWDFQGNARSDRSYVESKVESAEAVTSSPAQFPGGQSALSDFVAKELVYPESAKKLGLEGMVTISFTITCAGEIANSEVYQSTSPSLELEALRIVDSMPKWQPAIRKGAKVDSQYILPIVFALPKPAVVSSSN